MEEATAIESLLQRKQENEAPRRRLRIRSARFDANAAFTITEEILTRFLNGFEAPAGEGEWVIEA